MNVAFGHRVLDSMWVVWSHEHGQWWGPERQGYHDHLLGAGIYTEEEAKQIEADANFDPARPRERAMPLRQAIEEEPGRVGIRRHFVVWSVVSNMSNDYLANADLQRRLGEAEVKLEAAEAKLAKGNAQERTLKTLASAFRKILSPNELNLLVSMLDPNAPLNEFLTFLREKSDA